MQQPGRDSASPPPVPPPPPAAAAYFPQGAIRVADEADPGQRAGGIGPALQGWSPMAPPRPRPVWLPTRRELVSALAVVLALAAGGAAVGALWAELAPRLAFRVVRPGLALPVVAEAEEYVAADGRFALLTAGVGVLAGLACWLLRSSRGPVVLAALAVGGLLGAVVTWRVGMLLAPGYSPQDLQEVGRTVLPQLELGALAALVVEPFAAVLVYLAGVGFSAHNDLGRGDEEPAGP